MRRLVAPGVVLSVVTLVAVAGAAGGASGASSRLSIAAKPRIVYFKTGEILGHRGPHRTKIKGALASGKRGVKVKLLADEWPFKGGFRSIATTRSGRNGAYRFKASPRLATRYRVAAGALRSATRTVYVMPGLRGKSCTLVSNIGTPYRCPRSGQRVPPGPYTAVLKGEFLYPASAYARERSKPVYVYSGQRLGSSTKPPTTLTLVAAVQQTPAGDHRTQFVATTRITMPAGSSFTAFVACTQRSEATDGLGLPGPPGSHHCGDRTISIKQLSIQLS